MLDAIAERGTRYTVSHHQSAPAADARADGPALSRAWTEGPANRRHCPRERGDGIALVKALSGRGPRRVEGYTTPWTSCGGYHGLSHRTVGRGAPAATEPGVTVLVMDIAAPGRLLSGKNRHSG